MVADNCSIRKLVATKISRYENWTLRKLVNMKYSLVDVFVIKKKCFKVKLPDETNSLDNDEEEKRSSIQCVPKVPSQKFCCISLLFHSTLSIIFLKLKVKISSFYLPEPPFILTCKSITFDQNTQILLSLYFPYM